MPIIDPYRIAFSALKGMTPRLANSLLQVIGTEENFFNAHERHLAAIAGGRNRLFDTEYRANILEKAKTEASFISRNHVTPIYFTDPTYPARLLECDDAPLMLYTLGNCDLNSAHMVSIVGTRHATPYGVDFVTSVVEDLSKKLDNLVIISGLAYGIDITAHRSALHFGTSTVAVLGHGLNTIYPAAHRSTAAEMVKTGNSMLVTDYMSQDVLHRGNFLARNRIVAGMCDCLIVAESADKGGALVTAKIAAAYNRDVAALPGRRSDKYSMGCNKLIAGNIATLITDADDLIKHMRWTPKQIEGTQNELTLTLSPEEESVINHLTNAGEGTLNKMSVDLNIPIHRLMTLLVDMEFRNLLLTYPGGKYRLA